MVLYIFGAGGHARSVREACLLNGVEAVFVERGDRVGSGALAESAFLASLDGDTRAIVGVGSVGPQLARYRLLTALDEPRLRFESVVHPAAVVARSASLGAGVFAAQGAQIGMSVVIGEHVILNTGCVVDHDANIGRAAHIGPGAVLAADVMCGAYVHVGCGAVVIQGIELADGVVIGAGATVTRSIAEPNTIWVGSPARKLRSFDWEA